MDYNIMVCMGFAGVARRVVRPWLITVESYCCLSLVLGSFWIRILLIIEVRYISFELVVDGPPRSPSRRCLTTITTTTTTIILIPS